MGRVGYNVLGILLLCLEGWGWEKIILIFLEMDVSFGRGGFYLVGSF